jgi:hypothetical protein
MGRVFFNTRLHVQRITGDTTPLESDSNTVYMLKPAAACTFTLPTLGSTAIAGWNCKLVMDDSGTGVDQGVDFKINVDMGSGTNLANCGFVMDVDSGAGDHCVADDDFINISVNASAGDTIYFWTDGTRWNIEGFVKDASEVAFAQAAA